MSTKLLGVAFLLGVVLMGGDAPVSAAGCGPMPPTPPTPPGCKRLTPVCQCDSRGQNCHYVFQCATN